MTAALWCVAFAFLPDNFQLPSPSTIGGFTFEDRGGMTHLLINETDGEKGIQFKDHGMNIGIAAPLDVVYLRVGQFNSPVTIEAYDADGNLLSSTQTIASGYADFLIQGEGIVELRLLEGGNEGILSKICVEMK